MNKNTVKMVVALMSILILLIGNPSIAEEHESSETPAVKSESTQSVQPAVEEKTDKETAEQREKILLEANAAIAESRKALKALDDGKSEEALKSLELAIGKMALIVARDPELALATVDVNIKIYDLFVDAESIEFVLKRAIKYLKSGEVQLARPLIASMASEMVIESINIPLATYPDAIKSIVPLIDQGKFEEAKSALQAALNTLVIVEEEVFPLPVIRVKALLKDAEELTEKESRTEEDNKKLALLLDEAQNQLEIADVLGYGGKKDFKPMYEQLDEIRDKTKESKHGKGFFEKLKNQISEMFDKE
jgi:hypothetical protein